VTLAVAVIPAAGEPAAGEDRLRTMNRITINSEYIRLSQLLKLADAVATGAEARFCIQEGEVRVNGVVEIRRGRKLRAGDRVEYAGRDYEVGPGEKF